MPYRRNSILKKIDWYSVTVYLILIIAGWFNIYAASYSFDRISIFDLQGRAGMQLIWILTSLALCFALLKIDSSWYEFFAYWIFAFMLLLLIATVFFAPDIKGSRSWLILGPVRIQAAEFAKFATALAVARFIGSYKFELKFDRNFFILIALFLTPMLLILMQKETGSALVFLVFFLVMYREGMSGYLLFIAFCAVVFFIAGIKYENDMWRQTPVGEFIVLTLTIIFANGWLLDLKKRPSYCIYVIWISVVLLVASAILSYFIPLNLCWVGLGILALTVVFLIFMAMRLWAFRYILPALFIIISVGYLFSVGYVFNEVLQPHQRTRIEVTLGIKDDPRGAGYNVRQAMIAIGSGGLNGKGYLNGTQTKLKYVPEQDTDFIFCTIGEEEGFIGAVAVVLLYMFLIIRLIFLAERQRSSFSRVYGYCTASILFFHLAVNIGMVIGITPVIGIPLPFFSYGGSSLWAFTTLLFIFLRLDASRSDSL